MKRLLLFLLFAFPVVGLSVDVRDVDLGNSLVIRNSNVVSWKYVFVKGDDNLWASVLFDAGLSDSLSDNWVRGTAVHKLVLSKDDFSPGKSYSVAGVGCSDRCGWSFVDFFVKPNFVFYYGSGSVDKLSGFSYAIVEPKSHSDVDLASMNSLCYLSVAEVHPDTCEGDSPLAFCAVDENFVFEDGVRKKNPVWGSFYADVSSRSWQSEVVSQAKGLMSRGCTGLFLDTVDSVSVLPSEKQSGVVTLIGNLRSALPDSFIVLNGGFTVIGDKNIFELVAGDVDVMLWESFTTTFSFEEGVPVYREWSEDDKAWQSSFIPKLKSSGLDVWVLDYRSVDDIALEGAGRARAEEFGFSRAVSNAYLDVIYDI